MRIRQVRPEFWTDALVAALPPAVRLFYIGLWCVADDYGWFKFSEPEIAALLFPYETPRKRVRDVHNSAGQLIEAERLVAFQCGCGWIPTLARHQVNGGRKAATYRDKHLNGSHSNARVEIFREVREIPPLSNVSNVSTSGTSTDPAGFDSKMAAAGGRRP